MPTRDRNLRIAFAPDSDAVRLTREGLAYTAAIYVHLLAAAAGWLPAWTLALTVPILVPRWMIAAAHRAAGDPVSWP